VFVYGFPTLRVKSFSDVPLLLNVNFLQNVYLLNYVSFLRSTLSINFTLTNVHVFTKSLFIVFLYNPPRENYFFHKFELLDLC